ncbi:cytochrome P450 [Glomus cerebriforme]|uniref:Cytochrome P450 n=1 Tax=Glomus cerebriforme TaxID=658196 RepID=A0A397SPV0_9GLOM|nr:cytochrome P450 [Glomus cerebriforme]
MYIIEIIFGLLIYLIYLVIKYPDRSIGTKSRPDINGMKGYPLIGNLLESYKKSITHLMYDALIAYGPNTTYTIPYIGRLITVNSPELLEHVLKTKFDNYVKGTLFSEIVYDVLGKGIFNVDGQMWKFQRRLASYLFREQNVRNVICVVLEEETKILLNILQKNAKNGDVINLQDLFFRFTFDSFGRVTFGIDFESLSNEKPVPFAQAFDFVQSVVDKRFTNPIWKITELFTKDGAKMRSACKFLSDYAHDIIKKRRNNEGTLKNNNDILNMFMNAEIDDENGNVRKLNDEELKDIVLNLIVAGRDTTAQALSWMMYNIMVNPNVEDKLVKEINSLFDLKDQILRYDNIKQFQYSHAVFYETLRLHPSVPKNVKLCIKDDILPNGILIYAGEWVTWSTWAMGRDKRIWGEDAQIFIPERFLENKDGLKPNQYKFNSFNCGPRICLGQNFATIEALTVSTAILKQFKFELLPGQKSPPDFAQSLTLPMKDPLLVKVHIR